LRGGEENVEGGAVKRLQLHDPFVIKRKETVRSRQLSKWQTVERGEGVLFVVWEVGGGGRSSCRTLWRHVRRVHNV